MFGVHIRSFKRWELCTQSLVLFEKILVGSDALANIRTGGDAVLDGLYSSSLPVEERAFVFFKRYILYSLLCLGAKERTFNLFLRFVCYNCNNKEIFLVIILCLFNNK